MNLEGSLKIGRLGNLQASELETVLRDSGQTLWAIALDGTVVDFMGAIRDDAGFDTDNLSGRSLRTLIHPDDVEAAKDFFIAVASGAVGSEDSTIEVRALDRDGRSYDVRVSGSTMLTGGDQPILLGLTTDISREKEAERRLERTRSRFIRAFEQAPTGIALVHIDPERGALIKAVNAEGCRLAKRDATSIVGHWLTDGEIVEIEDGALEETLLSASRMFSGESTGFSFDRILKLPGRSRRNITIVVSPLESEEADIIGDEQPINAIAHISDVTEQRLAEGELQHQARHDPLTDLLNRRRFISLLNEQIELAATDRQGGALLMFDLDDFKKVNDAHGHLAGDGVLKDIAGILRGELRESDPVARLGGDEFAVLLPSSSEVGARRVAESLLSCFERSRIEIAESGGKVFMPSVSIGGVILEGCEADAEVALRKCDKAMYEAKRRGGNCFVMDQG